MEQIFGVMNICLAMVNITVGVIGDSKFNIFVAGCCLAVGIAMLIN